MVSGHRLRDKAVAGRSAVPVYEVQVAVRAGRLPVLNGMALLGPGYNIGLAMVDGPPKSTTEDTAPALV